MEKLIFTTHAVERFRERFPKEIKRNKISPDNDRKVKWLMKKFYLDGKENKTHLNDTNMIIDMYEKYGYETKFQFIESGKVVFVVVVERRRKLIVTVLKNKYTKKLPKSKKRIYA